MDFFSQLHPVLQGFLATCVTFMFTILGSSTVFLFKDINQKVLHFIMGFTGGIMLAVVFFSLLLPSIEMTSEIYRFAILIPVSGLILGTIFVIFNNLLLDKSCKVKEEEKKGILLGIAAALHNIPEGLVIGIAFASVVLGIGDAVLISAIVITIGVSLQNLFETTCIALTLKQSEISNKKAFFIAASTGVVQPLGGMLGAIFAITATQSLPILLAFACGAMFVVILSEIVPESLNKHKTLGIIGIVLGFIVMMILEVAFV